MNTQAKYDEAMKHLKLALWLLRHHNVEISQTVGGALLVPQYRKILIDAEHFIKFGEMSYDTPPPK